MQLLVASYHGKNNGLNLAKGWENGRIFMRCCGEAAARKQLPVLAGGDWNTTPLQKGRELPRPGFDETGWEVCCR